jgi:type II secretory pathway pseudopilin PulG
MPIFRCSTCEPKREGFTPTPKNLVWGFTVIEMIITFAIITALLAATAPSAAFNRREYILSSNQEQLRSLISRAKALTLSGLLQPGGGEKICGYGIRINQDDKTATIFSSVLKISPGDCPENVSDFTSFIDTVVLSEGVLNKITFDKGVTVLLAVGLVNNERSVDKLDIYFIAPDPLTVITAEDKESAVITLRLEPSEREIKLNKAGLIDLIYGTTQE